MKRVEEIKTLLRSSDINDKTQDKLKAELLNLAKRLAKMDSISVSAYVKKHNTDELLIDDCKDQYEIDEDLDEYGRRYIKQENHIYEE